MMLIDSDVLPAETGDGIAFWPSARGFRRMVGARTMKQARAAATALDNREKRFGCIIEEPDFPPQYTSPAYVPLDGAR